MLVSKLRSSSHHPQVLAWINGRTVWAIAFSNYHSITPKIDNTSEDKSIRVQLLFDFEDFVKEFEDLRWNRDRTKVLSPSLTGISKCPSFHKLIHLCSEHDPTILKSVLRNALDKCTEAEKNLNEEKNSKKRETEIQFGSGDHKQARVQHLGKAVPAISHQSQATLTSSPEPEERSPLDGLKSEVTANPNSQIVRQASTIQTALPVIAQASVSSRFQSPKDVHRTGPIHSPTSHLVSSSEDVFPGCDKRSRAEDTQNWTGSEYGLASEEDMMNESDSYREDSTAQDTSADTESHDCHSTTKNASISPDTTSNESEKFVTNPVVDANQSMRATLEPSSMPCPLRSSVTASPPSQKIRLTKNPTKIKTPTKYEVELGLVRGYEKIEDHVMKKCLRFSDHYLPKDDIRELFPIFRKLPIEIVKDRLLRELESRIVVPGQKAAIPSTADVSKPSDVLEALQSISMTTVNAKINRAYGQIRLYKSVQGKIVRGHVTDTALNHGLTPHRSILARMACCSAGNASEREQRDRTNSLKYGYEAGERWLDVAEWFGGEGIILIFATAGIHSSLISKKWTMFQRMCVKIISDYLPSIKRLVKLLGKDALEDYCRYGYLEREKIDAVLAFEGYHPPVAETEEDDAG